jgi:hypothetical protein
MRSGKGRRRGVESGCRGTLAKDRLSMRGLWGRSKKRKKRVARFASFDL